MKFLFAMVLLFFIATAGAQQIHLMGSVIDAKSKQPIAAATISILGKQLFYPANTDGKFNFIVNYLALTDSVGFSCIGYTTKKISISAMLPNDTIPLVPFVNMLQEVKVSMGPLRKYRAGNDQKSINQTFIRETGTDMAAFMTSSKGVRGTIQTVGFYLSNGSGEYKGGDVTAPFRIRIFGVDSNGMPGKELTKDIMVVTGMKNKAWFDVDMSAYHIRNPDDGFFVAFTLLNSEYYMLKKRTKATELAEGPLYTTDDLGIRHVFGAKNNSDVITPRLGIIFTNPDETSSYFTCTSLQDASWHWQKEYQGRTYAIRATIVPEQNQD